MQRLLTVRRRFVRNIGKKNGGVVNCLVPNVDPKCILVAVARVRAGWMNDLSEIYVHYILNRKRHSFSLGLEQGGCVINAGWDQHFSATDVLI